MNIFCHPSLTFHLTRRAEDAKWKSSVKFTQYQSFSQSTSKKIRIIFTPIFGPPKNWASFYPSLCAFLCWISFQSISAFTLLLIWHLPLLSSSSGIGKMQKMFGKKSARKWSDLAVHLLSPKTKFDSKSRIQCVCVCLCGGDGGLGGGGRERGKI